jgi:hemolysin activation/secretion protein
LNWMYKYLFLLVFSVCLPLDSLAGFLEMPEITEVPDLERKSMLKDLSVPSVRDRDPDPEAGPRLNVERFKLQGIVEYPELGITKAEIEKLIEGIRSDLMEDYKVLPSGFTANELEDVSNLLVEIEEETMERHVTDLEVQKLVWLVREQRSNRGITLGTIETIADRITQFYRERGFILAKAYIPRQEVRDGIVTLTLLLGTLGEVEVHGNEMYDTDIISSVFDDDLAQPVTSDVVEENIYLVNDYPGLAVMGFFEPGSQVGDTRLNLNTRGEERYFMNIRVDNHGTEETGRQRLYGEVLANNLLGIADQLHLGALRAFSPSNTTYWLLRYSFNLFNPRLRLAMGRTQNQFVVEQNNSELLSQLDINGVTKQTDVVLNYKLKRSRVQNYSVGLAWENIFSDLQLGDIPDSGGLLDDEVTNYKLLFNFDVLQESSRILHQGLVAYVSGSFDQGNNFGQDDTFDILITDYTLLTFLTIPYTDIDTRLILRSSVQLTESALSSLSQIFLGGPTRARAYPVNQFSADSAAYVGVDWIFNLPSWLDFNFSNTKSLKDFTQPFVFADAAYGIKHAFKVDGEDSEATLYDLGIGFRIFYLSELQGNLQFAYPISSTFTDAALATPDDSVRVVFDLQYGF